MNGIGNIDLHMHSTVSDGTDTPEELLVRVREAGIGLFALTDHDAIKGVARIRKALRPGDPQLLSGVEFSCKDDGGKYHILGYRYDPDSPAIQDVVETGHRLRMEKVIKRLDALRTEFHVTFPEEEVQRLLSMDNPGKPHIGNLMVKYGFAETKEQAIKEIINRTHVHSQYIRPEVAIQGILKSGGIPVLAHPAFGSGNEIIVGEAMEARLRRLISFGLQGVEAFYSGFSPKLREETLAFAEAFGLYVTAGSDYHGRNKLVVLGDTDLDRAETIPDGLKRFLEAVQMKPKTGVQLRRSYEEAKDHDNKNTPLPKKLCITVNDCSGIHQLGFRTTHRKSRRNSHLHQPGRSEHLVLRWNGLVRLCRLCC